MNVILIFLLFCLSILASFTISTGLQSTAASSYRPSGSAIEPSAMAFASRDDLILPRSTEPCVEIMKKASILQAEKHYLSICSLFKDEEPSLKEWIEYHQKIGVDHFYLYNSHCSDNCKEVLKPYLRKKIITLCEWLDFSALFQEKEGPWFLKASILAYENAFLTYRNDTRWLVFLDTNEYLAPYSDEERLPEILKRYETEVSLILDCEKVQENFCKTIFKPKCCTRIAPGSRTPIFKNGQLPALLKKNEIWVYRSMDGKEKIPDQKKSIENLKNQTLAVFPCLGGWWFSEEKAFTFIDIILTEKPKTWVEIGVFGGASLFPVLSAFKFLGQGTAIAIDSWDHRECVQYLDLTENNLQVWDNLNLQEMQATFQNMLNKYKLENYCTILRMPSQAAAKEISVPIDVLHIDGNYSGEGRLLDIMLYLPKVCPGGYILIRFYAETTAKQQLIDFMAQSCDIVSYFDNDNSILFRKKF